LLCFKYHWTIINRRNTTTSLESSSFVQCFLIFTFSKFVQNVPLILSLNVADMTGAASRKKPQTVRIRISPAVQTTLPCKQSRSADHLHILSRLPAVEKYLTTQDKDIVWKY